MQAESLHYLKKGTILDNRYRIYAVLGEGGFGITYLGRDERLDMDVAIKEFFPHGVVTRNNTVSSALTITYAGQEEVFSFGKKKFISEAKVMARFNKTPGIVKVTDFFEGNNTSYIVMEYLEGITLKNYLKKNGIMDAGDVLTMMTPVIEALDAVHKGGYIHRDISPDNIMLLGNNECKLMDFGAARDYTDFGERSLSVILKPGYAPPEQYQSHGKQGPWTDIYAFCATCYKCLTGKTPQVSLDRALGQDELKTLRELGIYVPAGMERAILKGLNPAPEKRYPNLKEFCSDFYDLSVQPQPEPEHRTGSESDPWTYSEPEQEPWPESEQKPVLEPGTWSESEPQPKPGPAPSKFPITVIAGCVCAVVLIAGLVFFSPFGGKKGQSGKEATTAAADTESAESGTKVTVSNLTGGSCEDAKAWAEDHGLNIAIADAEPVDKTGATPGTIVEQDPEAGKELAAGGTILVTVYEDEKVSLSSTLESVESLSSELTTLKYFKPENSFTKALSKSFYPNMEEETGNIIPGYVTRVIEGNTGNNEDAEALTLNDKVLKNREVSVVTSKGSEKEGKVKAGSDTGISVKNLIGKAVDSGTGSVYQTAEENNFYIGVSADTEYTAKDTAVKGEVAAVQLLDPETGKEADLSSKDEIKTWDQVLLVLSSGPEKIKITLDGKEQYLDEDSLTGYPLSTVKKILQDAGVKVDTTVEYAYSSSVTEGNVISTTYTCSYGENEISEDQKGGVHEGDSAVLVVSKGRKPENTTERKKDTGTSGGGSSKKSTTRKKKSTSGGGGSSKPSGVLDN